MTTDPSADITLTRNGNRTGYLVYLDGHLIGRVLRAADLNNGTGWFAYVADGDEFILVRANLAGLRWGRWSRRSAAVDAVLASATGMVRPPTSSSTDPFSGLPR